MEHETSSPNTVLYQRAKEAAAAHNITVTLERDEVHLHSLTGYWYFQSLPNGIVNLYHGNTKYVYPDKWHLQFRRHISVQDIMEFISSHDQWDLMERPLKSNASYKDRRRKRNAKKKEHSNVPREITI